jgi:large subunit ribosomal protein L11
MGSDVKCQLSNVKNIMAKKIKAVVKLQIEAEKASPAPPIGPALAQHGINMGQFCSDFNNKTGDRAGMIVPVEITVYEGGSYDFVLKESPAAKLILKELGIEKGSGSPLKKKVAKMTKEQLRKVAEQKMPDLNTDNIEAAMKTIEGTAKNMGVEIVE